MVQFVRNAIEKGYIKMNNILTIEDDGRKIIVVREKVNGKDSYVIQYTDILTNDKLYDLKLKNEML